jgi:acetolactate synthase-1/3 small subunit
LSRISGILAGRGFNIESLVVANTEVPDLSRMTLVLQGQASTVEQARKQLEDIIPVWAVLDYTHCRRIERELLLIKVSTIPEGYIELGSPENEALSLSASSSTPSGTAVILSKA